jgi:hypothetical protein
MELFVWGIRNWIGDESPQGCLVPFEGTIVRAGPAVKLEIEP